MTKTITAVVESGVLRPTEPLDLPQGSTVEVRLSVPDANVDPEERTRRLDAALEALWEEAAKYPSEWWDEFEEDLRRNRVTFEERI